MHTHAGAGASQCAGDNACSLVDKTIYFLVSAITYGTGWILFGAVFTSTTTAWWHFAVPGAFLAATAFAWRVRHSEIGFTMLLITAATAAGMIALGMGFG
jgi:hypothetical protein